MHGLVGQRINIMLSLLQPATGLGVLITHYSRSTAQRLLGSERIANSDLIQLDGLSLSRRMDTGQYAPLLSDLLNFYLG